MRTLEGGEGTLEQWRLRMHVDWNSYGLVRRSMQRNMCRVLVLHGWRGESAGASFCFKYSP